MSIDTAGWGALVVLLVMLAATLAARWGGLLIMAYVPLRPRVRQFISAMAGSVLVELLAPLALQGDGGARAGLAATGAVMLLLKKPLPAIAAGIAAAGVWRALSGVAAG